MWLPLRKDKKWSDGAEILVGEGEVTNGKRAEGDKEAVILENAPFLESQNGYPAMLRNTNGLDMI